MSAEDTIAVLREWGTLIAAIVAGVVTIINALRAREAVGTVMAKLGEQDDTMAKTNQQAVMETVQVRSDLINANLENHRKIDALAAQARATHDLVAELATRPTLPDAAEKKP